MRRIRGVGTRARGGPVGFGAAFFLAVALAGCISGSNVDQSGSAGTSGYDTWTHSAGGQGTADETGSIEVPTGKVHASMAVGGQASIDLVATDADGEIVLLMNCRGSGGCSKSQTSERGVAGNWQIELKGLYSGGVSVSVQPVA